MGKKSKKLLMCERSLFKEIHSIKHRLNFYKFKYSEAKYFAQKHLEDKRVLREQINGLMKQVEALKKKGDGDD